METKNDRIVKSANLHVIGKCNYNCSFCFDRCLRKFGYIKPDEWMGVAKHLKNIGIEKINIAGGEPLLYPYLDELCFKLKGMGFIVTIVSNGSRITEEWIKKMKGTISWIGLSIDSPDESDEIAIGRHTSGLAHIKNVVRISKLAHKYGIKVKLNITCVRKSFDKDFRPLIEEIGADRIKVFRALTLKGANDDVPDVWSITDEQFSQFVEKHKECKNIVFEDNDDMVSSYLMFDPLGRWMTDAGYEKKFLSFDIFVRDGLGNIVDVNKYYGRNAVYGWEDEIQTI